MQVKKSHKEHHHHHHHRVTEVEGLDHEGKEEEGDEGKVEAEEAEAEEESFRPILINDMKCLRSVSNEFIFQP